MTPLVIPLHALWATSLISNDPLGSIAMHSLNYLIGTQQDRLWDGQA